MYTLEELIEKAKTIREVNHYVEYKDLVVFNNLNYLNAKGGKGTAFVLKKDTGKYFEFTPMAAKKPEAFTNDKVIGEGEF